jgi:hypothetical protein
VFLFFYVIFGSYVRINWLSSRNEQALLLMAAGEHAAVT